MPCYVKEHRYKDKYCISILTLHIPRTHTYVHIDITLTIYRFTTLYVYIYIYIYITAHGLSLYLVLGLSILFASIDIFLLDVFRLPQSSQQERQLFVSQLLHFIHCVFTPR